MNTQEILNYETPHVEVIEVKVEKGFATSNEELINNDWD